MKSHFNRREFLKFGSAISLAFGLTPFSAFAATTAPLPPTPLPSKKPRAPRLLMIDPGHGGHDPGTISLHGIQEKDVTLDIAQYMAAALAGQNDITVKLTREEDVFLPLQQRVKIGRDAGADLFVSIHADSAPSPVARGLSCYTLAEKASDSFAGALADQENHADVIGGVDLSQADQDVAQILFDLSARRTRNTSQRVKVSFIRAVGQSWPLLERPMRAANFAVLRAPDIPSMLVETGFLSNPTDEHMLSQSAQRQKIARVMAKEIAAILDGTLFG